MNIGRRMFASLLPAAPTAVVTGFDQVGKRIVERYAVDSARPEPLNGGMLRDAEIVRPAGLDKFYKATQDAERAKYFKNLLAESRREVHQNGMPPSIDCLRSVSRVHKHYMMVQRVIKEEEERRSFSEMLMDKFGVREWFARRNGALGEQSIGRGF